MLLLIILPNSLISINTLISYLKTSKVFLIISELESKTVETLLHEKRIKVNLNKFKAFIMNIHRSNFSQEKITTKGETENLHPP